MSGMDMMLQNALRLLLANLPPEVRDNLAKTAQAGVELKGQLDRIEAKLDRTELVMRSAYAQLAAIRQHLGITDERAITDATANAGGNFNGTRPTIQTDGSA